MRCVSQQCGWHVQWEFKVILTCSFFFLLPSMYKRNGTHSYAYQCQRVCKKKIPLHFNHFELVVGTLLPKWRRINQAEMIPNSIFFINQIVLSFSTKRKNTKVFIRLYQWWKLFQLNQYIGASDSFEANEQANAFKAMIK